MTLKLDVLKWNNSVSVCHNTVTDEVFSFNSIEELEYKCGKLGYDLTSVFTKQYISNFIENNWLEYDDLNSQFVDLDNLFNPPTKEDIVGDNIFELGEI